MGGIERIEEFLREARPVVYREGRVVSKLSDGGVELNYERRPYFLRHRFYGENPNCGQLLVSIRKDPKNWGGVWVMSHYGTPTQEFEEESRSSAGVINLKRINSLIRKAWKNQEPFKGERLVDGELELLDEWEVGSTPTSFRGQLRINFLRRADTNPFLYRVEYHGGIIK